MQFLIDHEFRDRLSGSSAASLAVTSLRTHLSCFFFAIDSASLSLTSDPS
jgi:hypothetical protein